MQTITVDNVCVDYASFKVHTFSFCRYPPQDLPDVVVSELELWEVKSYWRNLFNRPPDYNIILRQRDLDTQGEVKASATFLLHESLDLDSSQTAYEDIHCTLEPLVDDCSVMMTRQLLEGIITPKPTEPSHLVFELVKIKENNVSKVL